MASAVSRLTAPNARAMPRHAQHRLLGVIAVGHEAAVDHVGRAGNVGQRGGDKSAGAGLRRRDLELSFAAEIEQRAGLRRRGRMIILAPGQADRGIREATMPSPRPVKPICSLVVALTADA